VEVLNNENGCRNLPFPRRQYINDRFGWYLKRHVRKVVNGKRLVQTKSGNNSLWRVEVIQ
jgi:hypothetical protein